MTFPDESKCMSCHVAVKADSAEIQKLAKFAAEKRPVPWVRVYRLPTFVFWSHKAHQDTGLNTRLPGRNCDAGALIPGGSHPHGDLHELSSPKKKLPTIAPSMMNSELKERPSEIS